MTPPTDQRKTTFNCAAPVNRLFSWLAFLAIITLCITRLRRYYPSDLDASSNSDAFYTYLPAARQWLEHGWSFLLNDPLSYRVAPLSYLWPAMWGADVTLTRWANCALFIASAMMMAKAARRVGSWTGAVIATLLFVYHPGIAYYMPKVLTEPLFLFGLMLMSWALIEILLAVGAPARHWYFLSSLGLAITLLTRPVFQLITLVAIFITAIILPTPWLGSWKERLRPILIMLVAASLLPVLVVVKNGIQFDVWSISTGTGAGLYYGVNPLRAGHEPVFMGFTYDIGKLVDTADPTTGGEPLERTADRIERATAASLLKNTKLEDLVPFLAQKFHSWALYSTPELFIDASLRKFRLLELFCIAAAAILWLRKRFTASGTCIPDAYRKNYVLVIALLGLGLLAMLVQLLPLLYNTRYNAAFLEPWLILLTAASVGSITKAWQQPSGWKRSAPRWRQAGLLILLAWVAVQLTDRALRHEVLRIDPRRLGPVAPVLAPEDVGLAEGGGIPLGLQHWRLEQSSITLKIPLYKDRNASYPPMDFMDGIWRFRLRVDAPDPARCREAHLKLEHAAEQSSWPQPVLRIIADGKWHTYALHGNRNLRPVKPGVLQMIIYCQPKAEVAWGGAELLRSTMPEAAKELWQRGIAINPYSPSPWQDSVN